jgi:putative transposase
VTVVTMDVSAEPVEASDDQLIRQLAARARTEGLKLTGEGGLLARLTKVVVESALEGEMDDHLGYGKHDPAGRNGGNSRNGSRPKTVLTEAGPVETRGAAGSGVVIRAGDGGEAAAAIVRNR